MEGGGARDTDDAGRERAFVVAMGATGSHDGALISEERIRANILAAAQQRLPLLTVGSSGDASTAGRGDDDAMESSAAVGNTSAGVTVGQRGGGGGVPESGGPLVSSRVVLTSAHFDRAVRAVRPSVSAAEQARYLAVHAEMSGQGTQGRSNVVPGQRATLA